MSKYFEIRKSDGVITNFIIWDGISDLGTDINNFQYVSQDDAPVGVGYHWRLVNGEWIAPVIEQPEE
jgi:hypothetical protein